MNGNEVPHQSDAATALTRLLIAAHAGTGYQEEIRTSVRDLTKMIPAHKGQLDQCADATSKASLITALTVLWFQTGMPVAGAAERANMAQDMPDPSQNSTERMLAAILAGLGTAHMQQELARNWLTDETPNRSGNRAISALRIMDPA